MSDNNGWPGKPGVPLNPDQEGWHWVQRVDKGFVPNPRVILWTDDWTSGQFSWDAIGYSSAPEQKLGRDFRYLGPVLTPAEVDARVSQARRDAREQVARYHDLMAKMAGSSTELQRRSLWVHSESAQDIRSGRDIRVLGEEE